METDRGRNGVMKYAKKRFYRTFFILIVFAIAAVFIPVISESGKAEAASKTVKMTFYSQGVKCGDNVYLMLNGYDITELYKINIKTSKKARLMKYKFGEGGYGGNVTIKNGHIYYTISDDMSAGLYRMTTSGKNKKKLAKMHYQAKYAISGTTIYYDEFSFHNPETGVMKKMDLAGYKKTSAQGYRISKKILKTNAKGYKLVKKYKKTVGGHKYYSYYYRKPNGKMIYLDTIN